MPRMNRLAMALIVSVLCCVVFTSSALAMGNTGKTTQAVSLRKAVRYYRTATWRTQQTALLKPSPSNYTEKQTSSIRYLRWDARLWKHKYIKAQKYAQNVPHKADWICIHSGHKGGVSIGSSGEGSWTANTSNGYYGGLQMDLTFQRDYGGWLLRAKGTANNWTPLEQMWVAENARKNGRGFHPWSKTAHACGLI